MMICCLLFDFLSAWLVPILAAMKTASYLYRFVGSSKLLIGIMF